MMEFLQQLQFLSEYDHLFFVAIVVILLLLLYIAIGPDKEVLNQLKAMDEKHKNIALAIGDSEVELRDRIAQLRSSFSPMSDSLRKKIQEESDYIKSIVQEKNAELRSEIKSMGGVTQKMDEDSKEINSNIKSLFEQQGVFLHDSLSELGNNEKQQKAEIEKIAQSLQKHTQLQTDYVETLRNEVVNQVRELVQKEREMQQEAQMQTTMLMTEAINRLAGEVDAKLSAITDKVSARLNENIAGTMQSFETLQQQIESLLAARNEIETLGQDITSLTRLVLNKTSGGITHGYLPDMLSAMLPNDAYTLNPVIDGYDAAAQLMLPNDQGAIIIDSSIVLQDFDIVLSPDAGDDARAAARQRFGETVSAHINNVAERFIKPPTTANSALLFIASETAFAEIQAHHKDSVKLASERNVWLVSPTTLAAALNMVRSAIKDQKAREQLNQMRQALDGILHEAHNFENRLLEIGDHVNNAMRSVHRAETAGNKLLGEVRGVAGIAHQSSARPALADEPPAS